MNEFGERTEKGRPQQPLVRSPLKKWLGGDDDKITNLIYPKKKRKLHVAIIIIIGKKVNNISRDQ